MNEGLPRPTNLDTAQSLESIIRSTGAIPATIAILGGRITVGLTPLQLEKLSQGSKNDYGESMDVKVSRRDLAPSLASGVRRSFGGTTISGTVVIADMVGIKIFATGGLGGVHRGGEITWDVSADLTELGRTPVTVVSAGAKSILDIGRTLEYLETQGVTVATYGPTKDFPAFFSRTSGFKSPWRVDNPVDAAKLIHTANQLSLRSGQLIAVPIPAEHEEVGKRIQAMVNQAVQESETNGVSKSGKDATPWLLNRVRELTGGESVKNNIALIENTALVGGQIAVELSKMRREEGFVPPPRTMSAALPQASERYDKLVAKPTPSDPPASLNHRPTSHLIVIGASAVDVTSHSPDFTPGSTVEGSIRITSGGVGRNMAEAAHRHVSSLSPQSDPTAVTSLLTFLGDDAFGEWLRRELNLLGVNLRELRGQLKRKENEGRRAVYATPACTLTLDADGALVGGVADFKALAVDVSWQTIDAVLGGTFLQEPRASLVAMDGNFSVIGMANVLKTCLEKSTPVWFEPTSVVKSRKILAAIEMAQVKTRWSTPEKDPLVAYGSPNVAELRALHDHFVERGYIERPWSPGRAWDDVRVDKDWRWLREEGVLAGAVGLVGIIPLFGHLIVKCGDRGVLVAVGTEIQPDKVAPLRAHVGHRQVVVNTEQGNSVLLRHYPALPIRPKDIISTTGAGDSLVGVLLAEESISLATTGHSVFRRRDPQRLLEVMTRAQAAAVRSLKSTLAVPPV